jgi:hypothetical protein
MFSNLLAAICNSILQSWLNVFKLIYHRLLAAVTVLGFLFYVAWNMFFLLEGIVPPSIMYKLTGIPSPTTGMYRSFIGIIQMDYMVFITNNPFVIPFVLLLFRTAFILLTKFKNKQPLLISNNMGISYLSLLASSEIWMLIK